MGTIRLSVGRYTTADEIDRALEDISRVVTRLRPAASTTPTMTDSAEIKLTHFTHGLGCACKLRPQMLEEILKKLPLPTDPAVLVGTETSDDAAVYWISDDIAVVQTVDFFTPVVDDPYDFGLIAAANSLSDIYAMGATPRFALSIVGFPSNRLPMAVLEKILAGAQAKANEAGIAIIGGHTVDDTEPKYGLAVTGIVHPQRIITNRTAQSGDVLILTKPLGTGILSTALKQGLLDDDTRKLLVATMAGLNRAAAEAMQTVGVNACTDVTGFGLLGHLLEMMNGSKMSAIVNASQVPFLPQVMPLATSGVIPGGTKDNLSYTGPSVRYVETISETKRLILNDAQTSGGLLISVSEDKADQLMHELQNRKVDSATIIGRVIPRCDFAIQVGD